MNLTEIFQNYKRLQSVSEARQLEYSNVMSELEESGSVEEFLRFVEMMDNSERTGAALDFDDDYLKLDPDNLSAETKYHKFMRIRDVYSNAKKAVDEIYDYFMDKVFPAVIKEKSAGTEIPFKVSTKVYSDKNNKLSNLELDIAFSDESIGLDTLNITYSADDNDKKNLAMIAKIVSVLRESNHKLNNWANNMESAFKMSFFAEQFPGLSEKLEELRVLKMTEQNYRNVTKYLGNFIPMEMDERFSSYFEIAYAYSKFLNDCADFNFDNLSETQRADFVNPPPNFEEMSNALLDIFKASHDVKMKFANIVVDLALNIAESPIQMKLPLKVKIMEHFKRVNDKKELAGFDVKFTLNEILFPPQYGQLELGSDEEYKKDPAEQVEFNVNLNKFNFENEYNCVLVSKLLNFLSDFDGRIKAEYAKLLEDAKGTSFESLLSVDDGNGSPAGATPTKPQM